MQTKPILTKYIKFDSLILKVQLYYKIEFQIKNVNKGVANSK